MKIKILLSGIAAMALSFSSCNLDTDDDNNYMTGTYPCCNLVIPENGDAFATTANYSMAFYYTSGTASLATTNLSLGYGTMAFTTNNMDVDTKYYEYNGKNADVTSFSGGYANMNGVTVQNVNGCVSSVINMVSTNDPQNPDYIFTPRIAMIASYTANYDYTVKTFMPDAIYTGTTNIQTAGSTSAPFTNDGVKYRVIFSQDLKKADIIFYNAKFASAMPVTINFVLQNLDVKYNKNGYEITGENITPQLYEASGLTPAPRYQITSFQFQNTSSDLTTGSALYTVQIGDAVYYGDFQGFYALTGPRE